MMLRLLTVLIAAGLLVGCDDNQPAAQQGSNQRGGAKPATATTPGVDQASDQGTDPTVPTEHGVYALDSGKLVRLGVVNPKTGNMAAVREPGQPLPELGPDTRFIVFHPGAAERDPPNLYHWRLTPDLAAPARIPQWYYEGISPGGFPKLSREAVPGQADMARYSTGEKLEPGKYEFSLADRGADKFYFVVDRRAVQQSLDQAATLAEESGDKAKAEQIRKRAPLPAFGE